MCESCDSVLLFAAPSSGNPKNLYPISHKLIPTETRVLGLHFCCWQYMRSSANFRKILSESQNMPTYSTPSPRQILTQNCHSSLLYIVRQIAIFNTHSHLTPPVQQTPTTIHINLILPVTRIPGLQILWVVPVKNERQATRW